MTKDVEITTRKHTSATRAIDVHIALTLIPFGLCLEAAIERPTKFLKRVIRNKLENQERTNRLESSIHDASRE
jgi:hypothetical protein